MNTQIVSIITPTYNHQQFIGECIESVLAQSYTSWEQIIVDDGSDDETPRVVSRYKDRRIKYIRLAHRGLSALAETYNIGLRGSSGELVAILEGDDAWPEDKLRKQVPIFDDESVYLVWGKGGWIFGQSRVETRLDTRLRTPLVREGDVERLSNAEVFRHLLFKNVLTPSMSVMIRRQALNKAGGFRQTGSTLVADLPTWLWVTALNSGQICFLNSILGYWRVHPQQTSQKHSSLMVRQYLQVVRQFAKELDPFYLKGLDCGPEMIKQAILAARIRTAHMVLTQKRFRSARRYFMAIVPNAQRPIDKAKALLGVLSSAVQLDLFPFSALVWSSYKSWKNRTLALLPSTRFRYSELRTSYHVIERR